MPAGFVRLLAALGGALAIPAVLAQQGDATDAERTLTMVVGGGVTWDDNYFRVPDSQPKQSERIGTAFVGLRLDKTFSQQRIVLSATETAYRYQKLDHLDFEALDYDGTWEWRLGRRLRGLVSAERSEALQSYADFADVTQGNVRTIENQRAALEGWLGGGWYLAGGAIRRRERNSVQFAPLASYRAEGAEVGSRYESGTGSSLGFSFRSLDGEYQGRVVDPAALIDDGFERREAEVSATWAVSGKTSLLGRATRVEYRSNRFAQRDWEGTAGVLELRWAPTDRLRISLRGSRALEPWQDATASFRVEDRVSLAPAWRIGAKTTLRMGFDHAESDYRNPVVALAGPARTDKTDILLLAFDWAPVRNLSLTASVQDEDRTSSDAAFEYQASVARVGATFAF